MDSDNELIPGHMVFIRKSGVNILVTLTPGDYADGVSLAYLLQIINPFSRTAVFEKTGTYVVATVGGVQQFTIPILSADIDLLTGNNYDYFIKDMGSTFALARGSVQVINGATR